MIPRRKKIEKAKGKRKGEAKFKPWNSGNVPRVKEKLWVLIYRRSLKSLGR